VCARGQERAAELGGTLNPQEAANLLWGLAIMGRAMDVAPPPPPFVLIGHAASFTLY
jgi:hypothetical protein